MSDALTGTRTVVLGDAQTFAAGTTYQEQMYNADNLRNTFHSMLLIDEIRFFAIPTGVIQSSNIAPSWSQVDIFDLLQVMFDIHGYKTSTNPIPIDLLCTDFQTALEQDIMPTTQAIYRESYRRWIPPQPIMIPPGDTMQCRIVAPGGISLVNQNIGPWQIWVHYVGRVTDEPTPDVSDIPYSIMYSVPKATPLNPGAGQINQVTVPVINLQNPLNRDLMIQRMVARMPAVKLGGIPNSFLNRDLLREVPDLVQISMQDSQGYKICESVILGALVDVPRRAWTFRRSLESMGYLRVQLTQDSSLGSPYPNYGACPEIALIGSRKEVIR